MSAHGALDQGDLRFSTALLGSQSETEQHCHWDGLGKA
jgi:hypothetical protein